MSALTLRLHKTHNLSHKRSRHSVEDTPKTIAERLSQIAWFSLAFLLSVAAGPFAAIGVIGAVFSLSRLEAEEPMPKEA